MTRKLLLAFLTIISYYQTAPGQDSTMAQTNKEWRVGGSGYFQIMMSSIQQSFDMPFAKLTIDGQCQSKKQLSFHLELRPTPGNPLLKVYLSYSLRPMLTILLGQLSNPIKYVEPEPEIKTLIYYSLYQHYVANGDDIGIAAFGKSTKFCYFACVINGTGRNIADNNTAKDIAAYLSYDFSPLVQLAIAGQTGQQPTNNRNIGFARLTLTPRPNLGVDTSVMGRTDLNDWGWYLSASYGQRHIKLLGRVHQTMHRHQPEWTLGLQTGDIPFKFQINAIIGQARKPELAALTQIYIQ